MCKVKSFDGAIVKASLNRANIVHRIRPETG